MATSWPSMTSESLLSGEGACTTGQNLYDIQQVVKGKGSTHYFADWNSTDTSYATASTLEVRCPDYLRSGETISYTLRVKTTTGKTATFQFSESGGTGGSEVTSTSTTYETKTSEITVPDDTWAGAVKTFYVKGKVTTGGTIYFTCDAIACNVRMPG